MSDDLTTAVARAMFEALRMIKGDNADEDAGEDPYDPFPWEDFRGTGWDLGLFHNESDGFHEAELMRMADAAIAVVIEDLAGRAESGHQDCLTPCATDCTDGWCLSLADWLRAQREADRD